MTPATVKADSASFIFRNNRARGHIAISVAAADGRTRRQQVEESGSYRIRFPNTDGIESEAVIVNTAGGVAGGDDFSVSIAATDNAQMAVTTAAAEKIYRAIDPSGAHECFAVRRVGRSLALAAAGDDPVRPDPAASRHHRRS